MEYREYVERFRRHASVGELSEYGSVLENGKDHPLLKLVSPGEPWLTITSGFHGEEQAGPLTLLDHVPELVELARTRGVGLRVYPCINPSGFETGIRYNASGEKPNNDFLRYEVTPGIWKGELAPGEPYLRWAPFAEGPKETRALRADLARDPPPAAALDIHQDRYLHGAHVYAYVFGDPAVYRPAMRASVAHAAIAAGYAVDELRRTDQDGLVVFHDGSITDHFMRHGVPWTAALETTTQTPLVACHRINLIWLRTFVDLVAGRVPA